MFAQPQIQHRCNTATKENIAFQPPASHQIISTKIVQNVDGIHTKEDAMHNNDGKCKIQEKKKCKPLTEEEIRMAVLDGRLVSGISET